MKNQTVFWGLCAGTLALVPVLAAPKPVSPSAKPAPKPAAAPKPAPKPAAVEIAPEVQQLLVPVAAKPQIYGPAQTGVTPGRPFLFRIPATGQEPLSYKVSGLPAGLTLPSKGNVISGKIAKAGNYPLLLTVSGPGGTATRRLTIVCGANKLALTPPMGWNTWNVFGEAVTAPRVAQQADLLIKSGLAARGFQYIIVDDSWQARRGDDGLIKPRPSFLSQRFASMRALSDFLHERGLKLGLMTSPNKLTPLGHAGSAGYESSDAAQYARWGVDYVKCDWRSDDAGVPTAPQEAAPSSAIALPLVTPTPAAALTPEEIERRRAQRQAQKAVEAEKRSVEARERAESMRVAYTKLRAALDKTDRDIVLSAVTYGFGGPDFDWVQSVGAQSWTARPSIVDSWNSLRNNSESLTQFADRTRPGFWTDPGYLMLGRFIPRNPRFSRLTLDEQKTQMTLWSLAPAPLILSCNLTQLDPNAMYPLTTALLTNPEVLALNQDAVSRAARQIVLPTAEGARRAGFDLWSRPLSDGTLAVGILNQRSSPETAQFSWSDLGLSGPQKVRDLWLRRDLGPMNDGFSSVIPPHGAILLKVGTPRAG